MHSHVQLVLLLFGALITDYGVYTQQAPSSNSQQRPSNSPPLVTEKYFGTSLGAIHSPGTVKGEVFIVDDSTLFLRGFTFPGSSYPFSFFTAGFTPGPDGSGLVIPDERGSTRPLSDYREKDIVLRLPEGRSVRDLKWFSIWSRTIHANLGHVFVPVNVVIPAPLELPPITGLGHGIRSGPINVVDAQTLLLTDFWYDGAGPPAYFWLTRGSRQSPQGLRLKDENDTPRPLRPYRGESFLIRLPDLKTVYDFDWFGVYSDEFQIDMGNLNLPQHIRVPPSSRMLGVKPEHKLNCEVLDDRRGFELRWVMDGDDIVMQLVGKLQPREYMAFGLSKDDHRSVMTGADAAVTWIDETGTGHAVDYFLGGKEQCVGTRGSCPDLKHPGATDSISLLHSAVVNGYTMVTFKRPQLAVDEIYDQHIYSDGQQGVIYAIGTLNARNEAAYHNLRTIGNRYMDFARPPTWNCPRPDEALLHHRRFQRLSVAASSNKNQMPPTPTRSSKPQPVSAPVAEALTAPEQAAAEQSSVKPQQILPGWQIPAIRCPKERTLVAQIGPAGKNRGYQAITGRQSRPIAWYINGLLIPELILKRGQVYTFLIEGGDDMDNIARRHPLYITDNVEGGFEFRSNEERIRERVFAGVGLTANGTVAPTAEGRLCEWKEPLSLEANTFDRFEDYQRKLRLECDEVGRPGMLRFKPDEKTPDTIYYQDFLHRNLGWKIRIVDDCEDSKEVGPLFHSVAASMPKPVKVAPPQQIKHNEPVEMKPNSKQTQKTHFKHPQQNPMNRQQLPRNHPLAHQLLGGSSPVMFNRANFNLVPHTMLQSPFNRAQQQQQQQQQSQQQLQQSQAQSHQAHQNHFNKPHQSNRQQFVVRMPNSQQAQSPQQVQTPHQRFAQQPQSASQQQPHQQQQQHQQQQPQTSRFPMKKIGQQAHPYFPNSNRRVLHSQPMPQQQSLRPMRPNKLPSMASGFVPISLDQQQHQQQTSQQPQQQQQQQQPSQPQQPQINATPAATGVALRPAVGVKPSKQFAPHQQQHHPKQGYRYKIRKQGKPLKRLQNSGDFFRLSAIKPTTSGPMTTVQLTTLPTTTTTTTPPPTTTQTPTTVTLEVTTTTTEVPTTLSLTTQSNEFETTVTPESTTVAPTTITTTTPTPVPTTRSTPALVTPAQQSGTGNEFGELTSEESQRRLVMSTLNGFGPFTESKPGTFDHVISQSEQQANANADDSILSDVMRMISLNTPQPRQRQRHQPQFNSRFQRTLQHNLF